MGLFWILDSLIRNSIADLGNVADLVLNEQHKDLSNLFVTNKNLFNSSCVE